MTQPEYYDAQFWATLFALAATAFAVGGLLVVLYKETKR